MPDDTKPKWLILLVTERSGTGEFRKTIVLPLRHPRQPNDIFHHPPLRVRTLRLLAALSVVAAPALAVPSLLMALTRVVPMASCTGCGENHTIP